MPALLLNEYFFNGGMCRYIFLLWLLFHIAGKVTIFSFLATASKIGIFNCSGRFLRYTGNLIKITTNNVFNLVKSTIFVFFSKVRFKNLVTFQNDPRNRKYSTKLLGTKRNIFANG